LMETYLLGPSGEHITELGQTGAFLRSNVYANGRLLATYTNDGTYFSLSDWLGSKRVVTKYDGTVAQMCMNLPFGDELMCSATDLSEHHFTGQIHDQESGNDYFNARYYSNNTGRFLSPDPGGLFAQNPADPQSWNLYAYARNNPLSNVDPYGYDCVYLNNAGNDIDRDTNGNPTGIDSNSNSGECGQNGGYWVDGTVNHVNLFTNSNDVGLSGTMGSNGAQTSTDAYYTSATGPNSFIINELGYIGLTGTVDLVQLIQHRPNIGTIGPMNPVDVAVGCAASGAPKLALDLSPIGILPDITDAAMRGSLNPLFNSGDRLNDAGNTVDVAGKTAEALAKTLPFLGPVAKKLGPVGMTISVVKAGRDFYNCVQ
jgi:RHS repeat-associated protein